MPRVSTKTKSTRGNHAVCVKCGKKIEPGTKYYEWAFFRRAARRQHVGCGAPKPSQLTQSKLSSVYAAIEDAEEAITAATEAEDIASALESVSEIANEVQAEYEEAREAMGGAGESGVSAERAEALDAFRDELEGEARDIEGETFEPDADAEETEAEQRKSWLEDLREKAFSVLGNLSI